MKILLVKYLCKKDCRELFLNAIKQNCIDSLSQKENGNLKYEYSYSIENKDILILTEVWQDEKAVREHAESFHFKKLGELKKQYVAETQIERYDAEKL